MSTLNYMCQFYKYIQIVTTLEQLYCLYENQSNLQLFLIFEIPE